MTNVLDKDIVKSLDAIDMVTGSIAKPLVEQVSSKFVGNGNLISGLSKLGIAIASAKYFGTNRVGKAIAIGSGMDGAEDLIVALGSKAGIEAAETTSTGFEF